MSDTDRCGCSEERLLCGAEACDATHPDGRYVCTKVSGHDGPHAACSPSEHPAVSWPIGTEQTKLIADGGQVEDGTDQFISNPNTRTMHYGTRETGAECGSQADSWAKLEAVNPLHAVEKYAAIPCTRCFDHVGRLNTVYTDRHSATVCYQDVSEVIEKLPWSLPTEADQTE